MGREAEDNGEGDGAQADELALFFFSIVSAVPPLGLWTHTDRPQRPVPEDTHRDHHQRRPTGDYKHIRHRDRLLHPPRRPARQTHNDPTHDDSTPTRANIHRQDDHTFSCIPRSWHDKSRPLPFSLLLAGDGRFDEHKHANRSDVETPRDPTTTIDDRVNGVPPDRSARSDRSLGGPFVVERLGRGRSSADGWRQSERGTDAPGGDDCRRRPAWFDPRCCRRAGRVVVGHRSSSKKERGAQDRRGRERDNLDVGEEVCQPR